MKPAVRPKAAAPAVAEPSPVSDYDAHYRKHVDVPARQLWVDIAYLKHHKKHADIEKALKAYLKYHGKNAESWMYGLLAISLKENKRDPREVEAALGQFGYLAEKSKDPLSLIRAADALLVQRVYSVRLPASAGSKPIVVSAGSLLDQAIALAPHRPEPIWMSFKLAELTRDPARMAAAAESLLALGWPGVDDVWRVEARRQVQALIKSLREDGKDSAASELTESLSRSETRDVFIRLTWEGDAWLALSVAEPLGATCDHASPRTVFGGALVKEGRGKDREVIYTCPRGFDGDYIARVEVLSNDPDKPVTQASLEVLTHEGEADEAKVERAITLSKPQAVKVTLKDGRRTKVMPYSAPIKITIDPDAPMPKGPAAKRPTSPAVEPPSTKPRTKTSTIRN